VQLNTLKLSIKEKIGYSLGDTASNLYFQTFMLFLLYFYTDVFGLPAAAVGTMFLITRIWDAVNDPIMGMIADRTKTRWGKFRPYLLFLGLPFGILGVLTFTTPEFSISGKIVYAYITYTLLMMLYTAVNVPYSSLMAVITPNSMERTEISSYRFVAAFIGGVIVTATLLPMAKYLGEDNNSIIKAEIVNSTIHIAEKGTGTTKIILQAEDKNSIKNKLEFGFRVEAKGSNKPFIKNPIENIALYKGFNNYTIDISNVFDSKDKSNIRYEIENSDTSIIDTRIKDSNLYIAEKSTGTVDIKLKAVDEEWGSCDQVFVVNINDTTSNTQPCLIDSTFEIGLLTGYRSHEIDLSKIFEDKDGDSLTYKVASSNVEVISPKLEGNLLSFLERKTGITYLTIKVQDNKGGYAETQKRIVVKNTENNPPYLNNPISNQIFFTDFKSVDIPLADVFVDLEGDNITYSFKVINSSKGWQLAMVYLSGLALILFLITFFTTKERVYPPKDQKSDFSKDLKDLFTNKPWLLIAGATVFQLLFIVIRNSSIMYYFKYYVQDQQLNLFGNIINLSFEVFASSFMLSGTIVSIIGAILAKWFTKVLGKKNAYSWFLIITAFFCVSFYLLKPQNVPLIYLINLVISFLFGTVSVLQWAIYTDTADYSEWKNRRRATGLIMAASLFALKLGLALGGSIVGWILSYSGFVANQVQTAEALTGIKLLMSVYPAIAGIIGGAIMLFYPLNNKTMLQIEEDLTTRRQDGNNS